jgi:hypothetical protein
MNLLLRPIPDQPRRYADSFGIVFFLALATYVVWSLVDFDGWSGVLTVGIACLTGLAALIAADARGALMPPSVALAGLALALAVIAALIDDDTVLGIGSLLAILLLLLAIAAVLVRIVLATEIGFEPILGAISVYTLLGIMFAFTYTAIHRLGDTPFFAGIDDPTTSDFVFFSFTTLTTTGYGNLVPSGQPGEMIAGIEMLMGQIFLVTLIARLVALWNPGEKLRAARAARQRDEGDPQ